MAHLAIDYRRRALTTWPNIDWYFMLMLDYLSKTQMTNWDLPTIVVDPPGERCAYQGCDHITKILTCSWMPYCSVHTPLPKALAIPRVLRLALKMCIGCMLPRLNSCAEVKELLCVRTIPCNSVVKFTSLELLILPTAWARWRDVVVPQNSDDGSLLTA